MNNKTYTSAKPFVKWVGGKTQLLEDIKRALPTDFSQNIESKRNSIFL
jgi:DNA adenine methylase